MPVNMYVYVGVAILAMFFGYFFGLFEGRGQGYKKREKEEEQSSKTGSDSSLLAQPSAHLQPSVPEISTASSLQPSLLRLSRDESGQLCLHLEEELVNTSSLTSDQRKRLVALLTLIRPWLENGKPQPVAPPPPAADPMSQPTPRPIAPPAPIPGVEEKPLPDAPQSMVAQIDAIMQANLAGTPLESQGIKLRESPEGGVLVYVGSNIYQTINDVPDEPIKEIIRASITAWEKKFTPGL